MRGIMIRNSLAVVGILMLWNVSHASDCSPGSPMYEDAFFKICDEARTRDRLAVTEEKEARRGDATIPRSWEPNPGGNVSLPKEQALESEGALRKVNEARSRISK